MAHFFLWFRAKFWVEPWRLWTSEEGDTARTTRRVMRGAVAVAAMALWLAMGVHPATAQAWRPMVFRADVPGIDENPLRGLVPYAMPRADASGFPHSMEWFSLPLSDVVAGPDVYNWAALERQLMMVAGHGNQAVVRFYVDNPKLPSGIPRYLLRAGVKTYPYEDEDNAKSATPSVAPDYGDSRLMECMVHFIRALGMKYDGDVRIAYLAAGLYGFWGEWHVLKHPLPGEPAGWAMAQKDKDALLRAYAESFHRTPVMVRTPAVTPDGELLSHFGFHDDAFLQDTIGAGARQFWPGMQRAGLTESWQKHPTGGEIFPPLQAGLWTAWPNARGQDLMTTITTAHVTFMFDSALFRLPPSAAEKANALRAQRMLGYTLFCKSARMLLDKNGSATLSVRIENRCVAPIYSAWPVEVESLNAAGKVVGRARAAWPLPTLLPGNSAEWSVALQAVPDRIKTVVLQIANPMPGGHAVAFANAEMGTVRAGWLTLDVTGNR